jgi:hypothetical protein
MKRVRFRSVSPESSKEEAASSPAWSSPERSGAKPSIQEEAASSPWSPAPPPTDDDATEIIKQPETRPISQEQLVAEVKGIYAGLVMVESKCIEVDNNQSSQSDPANRLNNDQWQALRRLGFWGFHK